MVSGGEFTEMPNDNDVTPDPQSIASARRPYRRPAFRMEQVFETQALVCGKTVNEVQTACRNSGVNMS